MSKSIIPKTTMSKPVTILIHTLIWVGFGLVVLVYQPLTFGLTMPFQFWVNQGIIFGLVVGTYYLNSKVLVPQFLIRNKIKQYILFALVIVAATVLISWLAGNLLHIRETLEKGFNQKGRQPPKDNGFGFQILMMIMISFVFAISTSITSTQKIQKDLQLRLELEQDKISSELSFLKAQINPHFFFNTLNNIYALTIIDVENSRKALHQLSRMMRYLLYETQQGSTLLSKEISFVKDYISLMQLRLTELTEVIFETPVLDHDVTITPMLLLPFVENAFKHGISVTKPGKIFIWIEQKGKTLEIKVTNNIFKEQQVVADENKGIGLQNTIRRLDLLYPSKYKLEIKDLAEENKYEVDLKIQLS